MNWNNYDILEIIEEFASMNDLIDSEEMLSDIFDFDVAPMVIEEYGEDDTVAMNEAFNNWSDSLCKDGTLHPEQYNNYCYVGEYS